MNKELLRELLTIEGVSGKEEDIRNFICSKLNEIGVEFKIDKYGNVYGSNMVAKKGQKYLLYNAHMDMVDISYSTYYPSKLNKNCNKDLEKVLEYVGNYGDYGLDLSKNVRDSLGCEDCNHVWSYTYNGSLETFCELDSYGAWDNEKSKNSNECKSFSLSEDSLKYVLNCFKEYGIEIPQNIVTKEEKSVVTKEEKFNVVERNGRFYGEGKKRVLGGDDRCGIFVILEVLRTLKENNKEIPIKFLFTVSEEIGCVGIKDFLKEKDGENFLSDCLCCITIDRKGNDNLLYMQNGSRSASWNLASILALTGVKAGIPVKMEDGGTADICTIREYMDGVNISCGYYSPHTSSEYVVLKDVERVIKWQLNFCLYLLSINMNLKTKKVYKKPINNFTNIK